MYPTVEQKIEIIFNAIEVAEFLGMTPPRLALLAAVDTVILDLPVTLEVAQIVALNYSGRRRGCLWMVRSCSTLPFLHLALLGEE